MRVKNRRPPSGQLCPSQIITIYGPGAIVDLPDQSVIIGGLEHWHGERKLICEERLEQYICLMLGLEKVQMYTPPIDQQQNPISKRSGISVFTFPTWFVAHLTDQDLYDIGVDVQKQEYRTRPLVSWKQLVNGSYSTKNKKKRSVVPVRFVQSCANGHISDLDWFGFTHANHKACAGGQLWLDEGGSGGDLSTIYVRCENCGARRQLSDAKLPEHKSILGRCKGELPWIGQHVKQPCNNSNKLLVRSASNAYFSQLVRVISIPEADKDLQKAVDSVYEDLQFVESLDDLAYELKKPKINHTLQGHDIGLVFEEIQRRKHLKPEITKSIKQPEIETLISCPQSIGEDVPDGDFYARSRSLDNNIPSYLKDRLQSVVLVHRLREVIAQVGFTRFEPSIPNTEGELELGVRLAALAENLTWVPAIENRGEGIFIAFKSEAIAEWLQRQAVIDRDLQLQQGFEAWAEKQKVDYPPFVGLPYIMLHSLAHLLITSVSLECGYAASAINERIYAGDYGYGILLYTGTSGSEGTLGGLVQVGQRIEHHITMALEMARLCSNDPICAQHTPSNPHEERFLHGAACHGCLLIAETSCERYNTYLDRALVVDTVEKLGAAFFP